MSIRFSDNILNNLEGSGFVVRNRVPRILKTFMIFLVVFDIICLSAYTVEDATISGVFLAVLVASVAAFGSIIWFFMVKFRNLLMATEFQAALLASATQIGTRFCFITNAEGTIFYVDTGFQKIFVNFLNNGSYTLHDLFAFTDISDEAKNQIFQALKQNKSDHMVLSFHDSNGDKLTMMVAVDVITRPRGYFIIRGRDYVEKRAEDTEPKNGDKHVITLLQEAVRTVEGGQIVADSNGKIVAVSKDFEQWLGYNAGEILQSRMLLGHIFHQYVKHDTGILLLSDFNGQVIIKQKNRATVTTNIQQKLLVEGGRTYGISAAVDLQESA